MNTLKTYALLGLLMVLLIAMGQWIGGRNGALIGLLIGGIGNVFAYFGGAKLALAMTGSEEVSEAEAPELYAIIRKLSQKAHLPMPKVCITPTDQPNAFATGRNPHHAAVAVTEGILRWLTPVQLEGVLAHELAHIRNRDILISTVAAIFAGAITWIANMLQWGIMFGFGRDDDDRGNVFVEIIMMIIAPIAAVLIQLAISRSREFKADASGARITGNPDGLADALLRLEEGAHHIPSNMAAASSHLFIVNPLRGKSLSELFSTHPPIEERVRRLRSMRH